LGDSHLPWAEFLLELIVLMKQNKAGGNPAVKGIEDVQMTHVADVMTMASLLIPERMGLTRGRVDVDDVGAITFTADPDGPHRFALKRLEADTYRAEIVRRILYTGDAAS